MNKKQFLRWASENGQLLTANGWKYIQIHKLESAFSQAYQDAAPWPGFWTRLISRLMGNYDVSITFSVHDKKPSESFKELGDGHVSVTCHADGSQDITRNGETVHVAAGEEDPYGTIYTSGLFTWMDLPNNLVWLERFVNELLVMDRSTPEL